MPFEGESLPIALTQPDGRFVRVSIAVYLPRVMLAVGLDPDLMIRSAGLQSSLFDDPDNRIDYQKLAQLTEDAAKASGCEHFGLLVGSFGNLETLGDVGRQAAQTQYVGDALDRIVEKFREHDTGAVLDIDVDNDEIGLRYLVIDPKVSSGAQITLGAIAVGYRILHQISEGRLVLKSVKLPMRKPQNPAPINEFFKCPVHFNSPVAGLFFNGAWLASSLPELKQTAKNDGDTSSRSLPDSVPDEDLGRSAEIIAAALLRRVFAGIPAGAESVSKDFKFNRRTLHRRLTQAGTSFQELRDSILSGLAQRFLNDTEISVTEIALLLGYSELSAFTRAFQSWQSASPSEYRKARRPMLLSTTQASD